MKKSGFLAFCFAGLAVLNISAQRQNPTPVSAAELEVREGSIRLRSIDLERVKRDANKPVAKADGKEQAIRFGMIKDDFENIQKSQDSIIKAYKTGKKIDYDKIVDAAQNIKKKAHRLAVNLFDENFAEAKTNENLNAVKQKSVKDLIIELDNTLGIFVASPIFQNIKIVDPKVSETTQLELKKIFKLSDDLSREASKMK